MNQAILNKIDRIIALSRETIDAKNFVAETSARIINDNLSKSIRSQKEARIFKKELEAAFKLAKQQ